VLPSGSYPFILEGEKDGKWRLKYSSGVSHNAHFDLDTKDTLPEHDMSDGEVDKVASGLAGMDHESVGEFHGFGTGSTKLAGHNHLTTLRTGLHDETKDTITCSKFGICVDVSPG
jgi:hypothetical protein